MVKTNKTFDIKLRHISELEMTPEQEKAAKELYERYYSEPYGNMPDLPCVMDTCEEDVKVSDKVDLKEWD